MSTQGLLFRKVACSRQDMFSKYPIHKDEEAHKVEPVVLKQCSDGIPRGDTSCYRYNYLNGTGAGHSSRAV
jgi:hypothetical protein